jgi:prepilin-type N-terminal cleavage/methylation domain-containing protein
MKIANRKGFTLAELLIVMFIMGVLTIIVVVNFRHGNYVNDLKQASTELLQNLRLAQQYTLGGSSINYCGPGSTTPHEYYSCLNDDGCCEIPGTCSGACKNGVPLGGYAINIASADNYQVFGDTDNNGILSDPDYRVIEKSIFLKGIHISRYKFGSASGSGTQPSASNFINVRFSPPEGTVHFYEGAVGAENTQTILTLLLRSDYLTDNCREVIINLVSGQVSEQSSDCSL